MWYMLVYPHLIQTSYPHKAWRHACLHVQTASEAAIQDALAGESGVQLAVESTKELSRINYLLQVRHWEALSTVKELGDCKPTSQPPSKQAGSYLAWKQQTLVVAQLNFPSKHNE